MKRLLVLVVLLSSPSAAFAQELPRLDVRGAFGLSNYLHSDITYVAPTWLAAVRIGAGRVAIEPEFAFASHEDTETFGLGGPSPTVQTTKTQYRSVAVNVLGRWGARVSGYAGGGLGVYSERHRFRQSFDDRAVENDDTRGPRLGAQMVGGVDIPVAGPLKIFGQVRYEVRSFEDPGGGSVVQGFAGLAVAIR